MSETEVLEDFVKLSKMIEERDKEIKTLKKALELACEHAYCIDGLSHINFDKLNLDDYNNLDEYFNYDEQKIINEMCNLFIKQAKEDK